MVEWKTHEEFVIAKNLAARIRISFERAPEMYQLENRRIDQEMERCTYAPNKDAAVFANELFNALFCRTSPREMRAMMRLLDAYLTGWDEERRKVYPNLTSFFTEDIIFPDD